MSSDFKAQTSKFDVKKYTSYALMYFFFFVSRTSISVLISVYLLDKGYSASQVSIVTTVALILTFVFQPIAGSLNDKLSPKKVCAIVLLLAAAFAFVFTMTSSFFVLIVAYGCMVSLVNSIHPTIERLATTSDFKYGIIRFWGTIGYATGAQLSGVIYNYAQPRYVYFMAIASMVIALIGLLGTDADKHETTKEKEKVSFRFILNRRFTVYLIITALFYAAFNINAVYLPAMLQNTGLSVSRSTTLLFVASLCELPVVFFGGHIINKVKSKTLLLAALVMIGLQMFVYAIGNNTILYALATLLINSVVAMFYVMLNMKIVATLVSGAYQMTALSVVAVIRNLGTVPFQILAGKILDRYSYGALYGYLFAIVVVAILVTLGLRMPVVDDKKIYK